MTEDADNATPTGAADLVPASAPVRCCARRARSAACTSPRWRPPIKVAPRKLEALEADRYDELPDLTFTRALAQTVCRALKIDAEPVLAKLPPAGDRPKLGAGRRRPERAVPRSAGQSRSRRVHAVAQAGVLGHVGGARGRAGTGLAARALDAVARWRCDAAIAGITAAPSVTRAPATATAGGAPPVGIPAQGTAAAAASPQAPAPSEPAPPAPHDARGRIRRQPPVRHRRHAGAAHQRRVVGRGARLRAARRCCRACVQPGESVGLDGRCRCA